MSETDKKKYSFLLAQSHIDSLDNIQFGHGATRTLSLTRCLEALTEMVNHMPIPLNQQEWDYLCNLYAQHGMAHIKEHYHIAQDIMQHHNAIMPSQLCGIGEDLVSKTYDMPQYLQLLILIRIAQHIRDNPFAKPISTRATGRAIGYQPKPRKGKNRGNTALSRSNL